MLAIDVAATEICGLLGVRCSSQLRLRWIAPVDQALDDSIVFLNRQPDQDVLERLRDLRDCLFLVREDLELEDFLNGSVTLRMARPRLAVARILTWVEASGLLRRSDGVRTVSPTASVSPLAFIAPTASVGDQAVIEPFAYIGDRVTIGDDSVIRTGARLVRDVQVGARCVIRENSVIGGAGFGIEKDDEGNNMRVPHLGGVRIGNDVEIGALNTVCSGTFAPTVIADHVKTDDHCHIAHNVVLGRNSIITAGTVFSGSVTCEDAVWLGPNSSVIQGVRIGEGAVIGIGAVVTKAVGGGATVAGSPAKPTRELARMNAALKALLQREATGEGS